MLAMRKEKAGGNERKYFVKYLPKETLFLSDTKAAVTELYKTEEYFWGSPLEDYARMRNIARDALPDAVD